MLVAGKFGISKNKNKINKGKFNLRINIQKYFFNDYPQETHLLKNVSNF